MDRGKRVAEARRERLGISQNTAYAESAPTNDRKFEIARIVCTFSRESDRYRTLFKE